MSNLNKENRLLLVVLSGGILFLAAAVCLVGILMSRMPATASPADSAVDTLPVEVSTSAPQSTSSPTSEVAEATAESTPTDTAQALATAMSTPPVWPTHTPRPSATTTPTSASKAKDTLSLSKATSTPIPPTSAPRPVAGLGIGNIAPDFTLGSNRASRVSLSELRGKVVILNFWASWCPPCRYEVPALQAIHNQYGPQGVVVLAVNEREALSNVERFAHDNGISFAVWLDEDGWAGNVYRIRSIPTTYFIDEEGVIRDIQFGSMTQEQVVAHLEKLLE